MLKLGIKNNNDEVLKAIRKGFTVHEIKTGILYVRMHGNEVSVAGYDWDAKQIDLAKMAAKDLDNVSFTKENIKKSHYIIICEK